MVFAAGCHHHRSIDALRLRSGLLMMAIRFLQSRWPTESGGTLLAAELLSLLMTFVILIRLPIRICLSFWQTS